MGLSHETVASRRESSKSVHSQRREECRAAAEMEIWLKGLLKNGYFFHTQKWKARKEICFANEMNLGGTKSGLDGLWASHLICPLHWLFICTDQRSSAQEAHGNMEYLWCSAYFTQFLCVLGLVCKVVQYDRLFKRVSSHFNRIVALLGVVLRTVCPDKGDWSGLYIWGWWSFAGL